jgi:hypothetical protein
LGIRINPSPGGQASIAPPKPKPAREVW